MMFDYTLDIRILEGKKKKKKKKDLFCMERVATSWAASC